MELFNNSIEAKDKELLESYLLNFDHKSSAQCFTSLFMWKAVHDFCFEEIADHLVIEGTYRPKQDEEVLLHYIFPPIPKSGILDSAGIRQAVMGAREIFDAAGEPFMIKRLTGVMKEAFEEALPEATITEDRTYFDYVYSVRDLVDLKGKKYHGKKNHYNSFVKNYEYEIKEYSSDMAPEVLDLVDRINAAREDTPEDEAALVYERKSMIEPLERAEELGYFGCGIFLSGRMEAFAFGGKLSDATACEHIEKGNIEYRGIYQTINRAFCTMLDEKGYEFVNREEDMGSENLRKSKLSYHPVELIDKYEVRF